MTDESKKKANELTAAYVKDARDGMTQEAFALIVNCTKANVSAWENKLHAPSPLQLAKICRETKKPLPRALAPFVDDDPVPAQLKGVLDDLLVLSHAGKSDIIEMLCRTIHDEAERARKATSKRSAPHRRTENG